MPIQLNSKGNLATTKNVCIFVSTNNVHVNIIPAHLQVIDDENK